jgi:predicted alpha-1,6-mannanase (GH76 family)
LANRSKSMGLWRFLITLVAAGSVALHSQVSIDDSARVTSPTERMVLSLNALMLHYDRSRGLWDTEGWWNAANSTTVIGDAAALKASKNTVSMLQNTFLRAPKKFASFRNEFYDDEGWWALAWIQAFDVTHHAPYLNMAESIFADMTGGWDNTCGGGIWWKKDRHYKNAIANELFLSVAAHLAKRTRGEKRNTYLVWAKRERSWFDASGMINDDTLVNDGLTPACKNNGRATWSYNQGVLVGGLTELSRATGDTEPLHEAALIAHAALSHLTDDNFILHDPTEPHCSNDTVQFKGIFVRNLLALHKVAPSDEYVRFFRANADSIWNEARTKGNEFSCKWSGPAEIDGAAATSSALDALVAAVTVQ